MFLRNTSILGHRRRQKKSAALASAVIFAKVGMSEGVPGRRVKPAVGSFDVVVRKLRGVGGKI